MAPLFDFPGKQEIVKNNEEIMNGPDFWNDQKAAQRIIRETNALKSLMENHQDLTRRLADPAPVATAKGNTPMMNDQAVINTAR